MGAEPWEYVTEYKEDIDSVLQAQSSQSRFANSSPFGGLLILAYVVTPNLM